MHAERTGLKTLMLGEGSQIVHVLKKIWKLSYLENTWKTEMSGTWCYKLQNCISIFRLPLLSFILHTTSTHWVSRKTRCSIFEVSTITPWPSVYPSCTCYSILYIIHNELSLVSSSGWYPLSMTLTSLSSMSCSQLADRGPNSSPPFILLPWPIWSMIALIITCAAECPDALFALAAHFHPVQITTSHSTH